MRAIVALVVLVGLVGCGKQANPYLGAWDGEVSVQGFRVTIVHEFAPDGVYSVGGELMGAKVKITGTYEYSGDQLTVNGEKITVDSSAATLPKALIDQGTTEIAKQLNKPQTGTVTWPDENTFVVNPDEPGNPVLTFRRKVAK